MRLKVFIFFIFIVYCTCSQASAQKAYLIFADAEISSTIYYKLDLTKSPQWIVRWNHSVTGITVSDYYYWDGQSMILTDSHTPAFDAGLGHIPGRGEQLSDGQNGYFIVNIDEAVPNNSYAMRVASRLVNHRIIHAGKTYSLSEIAERQRITISIEIE